MLYLNCKQQRFTYKTYEILFNLTYQTVASECLTHLPLDKMAAILADNIFKRIFLNEKVRFLTKISLKFVLEGPIDDSPALL